MATMKENDGHKYAFVSGLPLHAKSRFNNHSFSHSCAQARTRRCEIARVSPRRAILRRAAHMSAVGDASLVEAVKAVLRSEFMNEDITRVLDSFSKAVSGQTLEKGEGSTIHQRASSFVDGLDASPFIEDFSDAYKWVSHVERNWTRIRDELERVTAVGDLQERGNNVWAPPVVEAANAYGPEWRTLVLQDRVWDDVNTKLFPDTTAILRDETADVPCIEAFFARQAPDSGIKLHTDDCNFIMTMHLGLTVPTGLSWIEVGGERRYWEDGKALVFNTSFFHQTMNESTDQDRIVLLLRFWHPGLTLVERKALQFLFHLIEDPETHPAVLASMENMEAGKSKSGKKKGRAPSGRGFAK